MISGSGSAALGQTAAADGRCHRVNLAGQALSRATHILMIPAPVSELESRLGERHQPAMTQRAAANALNLLPLSAQ
jgi:hypothetical protein